MMTVAELIAALQKMPQDKQVELITGGHGSYLNPHTVKVQGDIVEIVSEPEDE